MNSEKSKSNEAGGPTGPDAARRTAAGGDAAGGAAAIRASIEKTRADMSGTVNAIEEKLSPARLKEQVLEQFEEVREKVKHEVREDFVQAKERVRSEIEEAKHAVHDATVGRVENMIHSASDTFSDTRNSIVDTVRANPVPAVLAGVGLTWLFMSVRSQRAERDRVPRMSRGYGDPVYAPEGRSGARGGYAPVERVLEQGRHAVGDAMHRAGDAAEDVAHRVRDAAGRVVGQAGSFASETGERVGAMAHDVGETANHLAHSAQERGAALARGAGQEARRIEHRIEDGMRENPLAVGAALLAVGATVGLLLPHTRREDQLMGQTRDRLLGSAEHFAHDAVDDLREKAQGAIKSAGGAPSTGRQQPGA